MNLLKKKKQERAMKGFNDKFMPKNTYDFKAKATATP